MDETMEVSESPKKSFLQHLMHQQHKLSRRQHEYKKVLSAKEQTREEKIVAKSVKSTISRMQQEKNSLRAQIWVASGAVHQQSNKQALRIIECNVTCQEHLAKEIHALKANITNMHHEITRVNKQVYDLNRKTVPEAMHQAHVSKIRKQVNILENHFDLHIKRESDFNALNAELREELFRLLQRRNHFNENYTKLTVRLNNEKKYILEFLEYTIGMYNNSIEVYEGMSKLVKADEGEHDKLRIAMHKIELENVANEEYDKFLKSKEKYRPFPDLPEKEHRRREAVRQKHQRRINLYNSVLEKLFEYCHTDSIGDVIEKYQTQESIYYSFFSYENELSYHLALLNNSVDRLYSEIKELKSNNRNRLQNQLETIDQLENDLKKKMKFNSNLRKKYVRSVEHLNKLLAGVQQIKDETKADSTSLKTLLGDFSSVNRVSVSGYLKILEKDVVKVVACVYNLERENRSINPSEYLVGELQFPMESTTPLDAIVLTQPCPECIFGDLAVDEDDELTVHSKEHVLSKVFQLVNQPEMQYLLHNISKCRLQRSHQLAADRAN